MSKDKCTQTNLRYLNFVYNKFEGMSVRVKRFPARGLGLQAQEDIPKGRVVAYYRTKLVPYTEKCFNYQVENPKGKSRVLDIEQFGLVKRGIPYVAAFSNEPNPGVERNCELWDVDKIPKKGYRDYKLKTVRDVSKGEELTWCYAKDYPRSYKTGCSKKNFEK